MRRKLHIVDVFLGHEMTIICGHNKLGDVYCAIRPKEEYEDWKAKIGTEQTVDVGKVQR